MAKKKKMIIVGGGIVGMTAAYLLAKAAQEVIVIDAAEKGQATQAAAGIICPWLSKRRNKVWYTLAKNGARYYTELIPMLEKDTGLDTSYRQNGAILLRDSVEKIELLSLLAEERRLEAPEIGEITPLSAAELETKAPFLNQDYHGLFVSGGARIEGLTLLQSLRAGAAQFGATFVEGKAIFNEQKKIEVAGEVYDGDVLLLANGAWMKELLVPLNLEADVIAQKGQLLVLQLANLETDEWPVVLPPSTKNIVPFDDGKVIIGATHEKGKGFDLVVTEEAIQEIQADIAPFSTMLAEATIEQVTVGTRPYTSDFSPMIGSLPTAPHIFLANGLGASGLTVGPYAGKLLADLALENPIEIDLTAYQPKDKIK
ncbi:NAD(P)/FAD-dependent oxidoreductase [Isobaculum melis]|uniref:Glycine oxidase n=1 Tax=Isobaculum melis TaxID=142588 RepID=A0A1H9UHE7_9LACT|nr:FAD-dependent oxidoreductase [Isobaculum melis]SES08970.1 glycine oxidase [Isobaculum melis]